MEEWKDIEWFNGLYKVWSHWEIKSLNYRTWREKILKWWLSNWWYRCATLCFEWVHRQEKHHRLVAKYFIPNPDNFPIVLHLDNNPLNCHKDNLKWWTQKENMKQCFIEWRSNIWFWKDNPKSLKIKQYTKDWTFIKEFESIMDAERLLNICNTSIWKVCLWKRRSAGGFVWMYTI